MEDEEGERKVMDMWSILGEQQIKEQSFDNVLKHTLDNPCAETLDEEKQLLQYNSVASKDSPSKNSSPGSKIVFKGFKKRILAQAQENETATLNSPSSDHQLTHANASPKSKEKRSDAKRGKITEYAQYLGLQPSSKTKCSKCQPSGNFSSTGKQALCSCNSSMAPMPSTSESSSMPNASNFKITRKVYLCAACGTYFENWNLFLHMRDIHKRHICLFCLGMFGQAERLSHHLIKKHSVPEMAFASVEDFYGAFKGSCYLVCCTCEKVFSETDNFYNHFCSPASKQDITASICTLCRQTGSHASTCSLAIERSKETHSAVPPPSIGSSLPSHILERSINAGSKNRRTIKNNRTKFPDDSVNNSIQQKPIKKTSNKSTVQSTEAQDTTTNDGLSEDDAMHNSLRDTVAETIMEVSRCIEERNEETKVKIDTERCEERTSDVESPVKDISNKELYDSVTETIMQVSQCTNLENAGDAPSIENTDTCEALNSDKSGSDSENVSKEEDTEFNDSTNEIDDKPSSPVDESIEEDANEEKSEEISEAKSDTSSQPPNSPVHSPISRSLFSPQHESLAPDPQASEEETPEKKYEEPESHAPTESQSSVSFNAVPSSDRSLVIKICTNRNSQFSVTSATVIDSGENHDASRESEENNNADGSPSEKVSNVSERERDSTGSYLPNEGDSDSDSFKLAVVDGNTEAAEDADEVDETRTTAKSRLESSAIAINDTSYAEDQESERSTGLPVDESYDVNGKVQDSTSQDGKADPDAQLQPNDGIVLAGDDVPCVDLNVEGTLDSIEIEELLKGCIDAGSPVCVYCNHARHVAVNGKQLGLHMLAEHKFQPQHPAIIIQAEQFITRVKKSLDELDSRFFNLDSYSSTNGTYNIPGVRTYECFHCRFYSTVHKELYLHNRKMHQKTILICIMCKSTFYSYSELLCHLCPGIYSPNINVKYRCCLCSVTNLPSAFRLMVHLRKRHHACDVCLEPTGNQQRLSNHVWKHKLHHLCYRCGIAYRNKPDITKHLFWKHGTESVLCKKCLQKKWPHIYHFCIPPTAFVCEECGSSFSRAVALKVHKRLHSGDLPYACTECTERFISKKLLARHEDTHREQPPIDVTMADATSQPVIVDDENTEKESIATDSVLGGGTEAAKETKETLKKVVDVYDLPPLNLSSESDTDTEDEKPEAKETTNIEKEKTEPSETVAPAEPTKLESPVTAPVNIVEVERNEEEKKQEAEIMGGIWDNFKSYTASLEKQESGSNFVGKDSEAKPEAEPEPETDVAYLRSIVLADHDYCVVYSEKSKSGEQEVKEEGIPAEAEEKVSRSQRSPSTSNAPQPESDASKKKVKSPKKKKQGTTTSSSDSSSDSDSSSCSCGTNCSCSSSSSGSSSSSSSSSDSDSSASESSPKKQSSRKERKKEKETPQEPTPESADAENKEICVEVENGAPTIPMDPVCPSRPLLRESDLETDETETDEDFYDEHPQQLANKLLAEKRNQLLLLAAVAPASVDLSVPLNNGVAETETAVPSPEPISTLAHIPEEQPQQKKKVKTKKRKKGERNKQRNATPTVESIKLNIPKAFYQKTSGYSSPSPGMMTLHPSRSSTPNIIPNDIHVSNASMNQQTPVSNQSGGDASSGQENKRFSKRKRVPKRFYGDSSDEESEKPPVLKWRKVETPSYVPTPTLKTIPPRVSFAGRGIVYRPPPAEPPMQNTTVAAAASATESEEPAESSSDSSDSEVEPVQQQPPPLPPPPPTAPVAERNVNLYCYCQCPYDEVSEMIACDGEDCRIEWFHFECVGIMVPPKGKWYCPDCRKKHGIVTNSEDYFD